MKLESIDIKALFQPFGTFFMRFHSIIFFVLVSAGLIVSILMIVSILNISASIAPNATDKVTSSFDEATITQVEGLGEKSPSKPGGRPSPFIEP